MGILFLQNYSISIIYCFNLFHLVYSAITSLYILSHWVSVNLYFSKQNKKFSINKLVANIIEEEEEAFSVSQIQIKNNSLSALIFKQIKKTWSILCWVIQQSWFARVNALCNLSRKKSREVAAHFWADFWVGVASCCI